MSGQLKVWSERRPGSWDQCTEGAYLMALVYGGFRDFPKGRYTDEERNGLDKATPPDPEAGGSTFTLLDAGARARYGLHLHEINDGTKAGLRAELKQPGQALAIAGSLGSLDAGHRLRRWQPAYTGGHAIAVVTLGDGEVWWGDPLAPMGDGGDRVSIQAVLDFAWYPSDARVVRDGELAVPRLRRRVKAAETQRDELTQLVESLDVGDLRTKLRQLLTTVTELADDLDPKEG
jgi:hypothetical protein